MRCYAVVLVCSIALFGCSDDSSQNVEMIYYLDWNTSGFETCDILINGFPVVQIRPEKAHKAGMMAISWFLHDGENDFQVVAQDPYHRPTFVEASIYYSRSDRNYNSGRLVYRYYRGDAAQLNEHRTFTAAIPQQWSWQAADEVTSLSEDDRHQILNLISELLQAYQSRDPEKVDALFNDEDKIVYGQKMEWQYELLRKAMPQDFAVEALPMDRIWLTPYGRLLLADNEVDGVIFRFVYGDNPPDMTLVSPQRLVFMRHAGVWALVGPL